jgi:gluconate 5-dehydrogenase
MTEWTFSHRGEAILAHTPMKRFGQLNELKGIVIFLSSQASDYLTGQIIGVDGGLSAW